MVSPVSDTSHLSMASRPAMSARPLPRVRQFDSSMALLRDPYRFIGRQCDVHQTDAVEGRLFLRRTIFMRGAEAARRFYDPQRFQREGAAPEPLRATLLGKGGVQGLDGSAHLDRKALFLQVLAPDAVDALVAEAARQWRDCARDWTRAGAIPLYPAAQAWLARAAFTWSGLRVAPVDLTWRTRQLVAMFDAAASVWRHPASRWARWRSESWLMGLVEAERASGAVFREGSPAHAIATYRDPAGQALAPRIAAVEILNLLRPPERFLEGPRGPFDFVPQGGGDARIHHRCPGESVAIRLTELATQLLVSRTAYEVPSQDLRLNLRHAPAVPIDGMVLANLRIRD